MMNPETLLYRMVHRSWMRGDMVSSVAFRPRLVDGQLLGVFDGDRITLEGAWNEFTTYFQGGSLFLGIVGVTLAECEGLDLPVLSDPYLFPARAYIDFTGLGRAEIRRKAYRLRECANARGWLFRLQDQS